MKARLIIIGVVSAVGVVALAVYFLFFGIPLGSEVCETRVCGERGAEERIILKKIAHDGLYPFHPDGAFKKTYYITTSVFSVTPRGERELPFLTDPNSQYELMDDILPVPNSKLWLAFRLFGVRRESVDFRVFLFDRTKLVQTFEIMDAIRDDTCAEHWRDIGSYSIIPRLQEGGVMFTTKTGRFFYEVKSGRLLPRT
ncbi:MAG: hypothetical protein HZC54_19055 [Verrucomicrobia bacterium]|nr:hypothetical protein [Verrucomicrobiota bacterium]